MQREAISTPNVRIDLECPILSPFQILLHCDENTLKMPLFMGWISNEQTYGRELLTNRLLTKSNEESINNSISAPFWKTCFESLDKKVLILVFFKVVCMHEATIHYWVCLDDLGKCLLALALERWLLCSWPIGWFMFLFKMYKWFWCFV